ncbi:hypothetical protein NL676_029795 [Syzygium grande]|nr:hypothetical protein NL676_029795 [Syzygium grande]
MVIPSPAAPPARRSTASRHALPHRPTLTAKPDRRPEVGELRVVAPVEQDVLGLHVALDDREAVAVQPFDEMAGRGAMGDKVEESAAVAKLENEGEAVRGVEVR